MSLQQFIHDLDDAALTDTQKHQSFQNFITYFDGLKTQVLGNRVIVPLQLSTQIFRRNWRPRDEVNIFRNHLFAAHCTLHRYQGLITVANFAQFKPILTILAYDLYNVVAYTEINILHHQLNYGIGVRPEQIAREIFDTSCRIMNLDLQGFNPRELIPVPIFLI